MTEELAAYKVEGRRLNQAEVGAAAKKLIDLSLQFDKMNEEEKRKCIAQVQEECYGELVEFYNALHEYME